ncbi:MAG: YitT family protein [Bacillota bacterium]
MKKLKDFLILTVGALLVSIGVYFFKFPNNFSTGGVSGASVILGYLFKDISPGTFVLIINVLLLLIGFVLLGRSFGIKTCCCSLLMSLSIFAFEKIVPLSKPLTDQPLLELFLAIIVTAAGSSLLFTSNASTGGTDIVAMILKKYSNLDISKALFVTDFLIVLASGLVFGVKTGLFSLFGLLFRSLAVNNMIESINLSKFFIIITQKSDLIVSYINETLKSGATVAECKGAFTNENRAIVFSVLHTPQAIRLRQYIKEVDSNAFVVISNTSDIIGRKFREML